jgi:hypothetical protein
MKYGALVLLIFFMAACQTDESRQKAFAGQYQVTLHLPQANDEMEDAKKEVEKELSKAKEEIEAGIAEAKEEIEADLGEKNHFGNAVGNLVEGIGELAQGMVGLGESLGKMGIDLGQGIIEGLKFKAEFKDDGTVRFGKRSRIKIGAGEGSFWEIKDGKFYLWEDENDKKAFEMKDLGGGNWDLLSDEIIFHLEKIKAE